MTESKVYKFALELGLTTIQMPVGAKILKVALQYGEPVLWAQAPNVFIGYEQRQIVVAGTGHLITTNVKYIDTVLMEDDQLVLHFFEVAL